MVLVCAHIVPCIMLRENRMTKFEKHTDKELLAECWNCIGDLRKELELTNGENIPYHKAIALLDEIDNRKGN